MANTEFEYVRDFEVSDRLLKQTWIVIRIDGRGFSKFTKRYNFEKPNDRRAIDLMNAAACETMRSLVDIVLAYGQSDEYSFVLDKDTSLFDRRASKLVTTIATMFSVEYAMLWPRFFPETPLTRPYPTFDGRAILYPNDTVLKDYIRWRQADCHVNNLYNTTFWSMVQRGGRSPTEAELELKGTVSADKNEILFSQFGINYNNEPEVFRKGSVIYRELAQTHDPDEAKANDRTPLSRSQADRERKRKQKATLAVEHVDLIKETFWEQRPWILSSKRVK